MWLSKELKQTLFLINFAQNERNRYVGFCDWLKAKYNKPYNYNTIQLKFVADLFISS